MADIITGLNWLGRFTWLDVSPDLLPDVKKWLEYGNPLSTFLWGKPTGQADNILMDAYLLAAVEATYQKIDRLVITNQTSSPQSNETGYTGALYTTIAGDEFFRSPLQRPYRIAWTIGSTSGNGNWGSYCLIDANGNLINRAIANTSKKGGTSRVIEFEGTVN